MTNADKIRNMSDEELAETYINVVSYDTAVGYEEAYQSKHSYPLWENKNDAIKAELEWLQSEVDK